MARARSISGGFRIRSVVHCSARSFSRLFSQRVREGSDVVRVGKSLAWLNCKKVKEAKGLERGSSGKSSHSSRWWPFLGGIGEEDKLSGCGYNEREDSVEGGEAEEELEENRGRKTWKEATESTVPKIVGEGVYGAGPVLAALSAGRREFYALYIQEGLDLSGNNWKKKDKKRFEKVLWMAKKTGLSTKEVSKHDLNMIVDNHPDQGLVLDASPLEFL
ncbi:hypothetical protein H0E87_012451 [Populus deltoides]|uniref:RNA 2-O ribose methyltransferase substrate binding domain-containing protein n=1 Tax=Populus deltoides TaxID=3696 RepID=A0A8T2YJC0_POPDE|nr:hypothetical protein H0E87_012451 [Populus deltoides]